MNRSNPFAKAKRTQAKLRLAIEGPSGSGKTMSALRLAKGLGGRVAVIDTERGSASLYDHVAEFDTIQLSPPFHPDRFIDLIRAAADNGYEVVIIDSLSHAWNGEGGMMDLTDAAKNSRAAGGNSWAAWAQTTPIQNRLVNAIIQAPLHVIVTLRTKVAWETQEDDRGRKKPVKIGLKPEQREGLEYEFTSVLDVGMGHYAEASKDRTGLFAGGPVVLTEEVGVRLREWLDGGASPEVTDPQPERSAPTREDILELFGALKKARESLNVDPAIFADAVNAAARADVIHEGRPNTAVITSEVLARLWPAIEDLPELCAARARS